MAARVTSVALLFFVLPVAGCGTFANLVTTPPAQGGKTPFGGVRQDVARLEGAANGESGPGAHPNTPVAPRLVGAVDLPFSFVGDVVTWPYTASYSFINQPVPTPPVIQAPTQPPTQATARTRPDTTNLETLPEPRQLP